MKTVFEWLINNWHLVIVAIAVITVIVVSVKKFLELPTEKQIAKVKECLLAWVIEAEKDFGDGTGQVKLSTVYGLFVTSFPILKNFVSLETFSKWVDDALVEMRKMLEENSNLKDVVVKK